VGRRASNGQQRGNSRGGKRGGEEPSPPIKKKKRGRDEWSCSRRLVSRAGKRERVESVREFGASARDSKGSARSISHSLGEGGEKKGGWWRTATSCFMRKKKGRADENNRNKEGGGEWSIVPFISK